MSSYFKIVRPLNLLIIALTMYLVRHCLIIPIFKISERVNPDLSLTSMLHLNEVDFIMLVIAAICLAAAGNVINDYFDRTIDSINKPEKIIIGKNISEKSAQIYYWILNVIGLLLTAYCAWKANVSSVFIVNIFALISLYVYSWMYKKTFLLGNLLIAFLSAGITVLAALPEPEFYVNSRYVLVYTAFALLLSLIREIVKDMEDIEGDEAQGCRTIPVVIGIKNSRILVSFLCVSLISFVTYVIYVNFYVNSVFSFGNLLTLALLPFVILFFLILQTKDKRSFRVLSGYIKFLMLFGILSMIPFYYFFLR